MSKNELKINIYEREFHRDDSAISCARIVQKKEDKVFAVIEFKNAKNFWNDLTWTPAYDELAFILSVIYEAEAYNRFVDGMKDSRGHGMSFGAYSDMMKLKDLRTDFGWVRVPEIPDREFHFAGENNEIIMYRLRRKRR